MSARSCVYVCARAKSVHVFVCVRVRVLRACSDCPYAAIILLFSIRGEKEGKYEVTINQNSQIS